MSVKKEYLQSAGITKKYSRKSMRINSCLPTGSQGEHAEYRYWDWAFAVKVQKKQPAEEQQR